MTSSQRKAPDQRVETHKYKNSVGIGFPVLYHLLIFFCRHFQVHGENMPGAIGKVRYTVQCLILGRLRWVLVYTYSGGRVRKVVIE
jgi:hypothetical protein